MKKKLLLAGLLLGFYGTEIYAQKPLIMTDNKFGPRLTMLQQHPVSRSTIQLLGIKGKKNNGQQVVKVWVNAEDANKIAALIHEKGFDATVITDQVLTASLPMSLMKELATRKDIYYFQAPRKAHLLMNTTRKVTGADKVQAGEGLETPFDGTGVVVGVIDQGFEFRHIAFLDKNGKSRVKEMWNRNTGMKAPTNKIPEGGDGMEAEGHATHVSNIAAGSDAGNGLYGMAPKADLYFVPSTFGDEEVAEDVKAISDYAKQHGEPFVINMSFGSQIGPHDGTTLSDRTLDKFIKKGGFICAAMGNEGSTGVHAMHYFTKKNETRYLMIEPDQSSGQFIVDLWAWNKKKGTKPLKINFIYEMNGVRKRLNSSDEFDVSQHYSEVNPYNGKQEYAMVGDINKLYKKLNTKQVKVGLEISGNPGDTLHAWASPSAGTFAVQSEAANDIVGDQYYAVSEAGASIPHSFAVAAYAATDTYRSIKGDVYKSEYQKKDDIAYFSSRGPWLGNFPKPTVAAPGFLVKSAMSKYDTSVDLKGEGIVDKVMRGIKTYYYAELDGTSMATPVVTGTVALWLQANPNLTYDQMMEIFKTTSIHDQYTGNKWNRDFGFGKINAYDGIKKALEFKATGIEKVFNAKKPVTLSISTDLWKILFNNNESFANIECYSLTGDKVYSKTLRNIACGQELQIATQNFGSGVYILRIRTTLADYTKKVVVK